MSACSLCSGSGWVQNRGRLSRVCEAKNDERGIRTRIYPAVGVVDINVGFAESRSRPCQLARSVWKFDLSDLRLCVAQALVIQDIFGRARVVHHEANHTIPLCGDRLERQNVHFALSQDLANLCESAWPILRTNSQFFGCGHVGYLLCGFWN